MKPMCSTRRQQRGSRAAGRDGKFDELRLHVSARDFQHKIQALQRDSEIFYGSKTDVMSPAEARCVYRKSFFKIIFGIKINK